MRVAGVAAAAAAAAAGNCPFSLSSSLRKIETARREPGPCRDARRSRSKALRPGHRGSGVSMARQRSCHCLPQRAATIRSGLLQLTR
jgi:hypothetical protein